MDVLLCNGLLLSGFFVSVVSKGIRVTALSARTLRHHALREWVCKEV
jgi:hypothetical protein